MPVQKFRSAEEMNAAPLITTGAEGFERFLRLCSRLRRIAPPREYPRGVFRFRTLEDAQAARERVASQGNL